jgi:hypothetical protein
MNHTSQTILNACRRLKCKRGTGEDVIREFENLSGVSLPEDYRYFLTIADGAEGFLGEEIYVMLWPVEEILEMNTGYEVQEYAPGLLLFGSNGGGEAYAFDTRDGRMAVVSVPFVGMDLSEIRFLAPSFNEFVEKAGRGEIQW